MTRKLEKQGAHHGSAPKRLDLGGGAVGFVESSNALPLVSIVVTFRTGATGDPPSKDGVGRLAARMLRRGTEGMTAPEIETAIDSLGAELGLDVGPTTTSLHAQVIRRNLVPFCELLAKVIGKPTFPDDELARLRRETIAEILDSRDNDRALASLALRRALFAGHPYSRSAVGRPKTIEHLSKDDVLAAYRARFVRADMVVGFAGAISEEEARTLGAQLASAVPEGARSDVQLPEPNQPSGRRLVFVDKPERTQTQILIATLGTWPHDPDHFPLVCATAVLGGTFTSRMMREIRSKRGWSYGTGARLAIERRRHAFTMSAAPGAADCPPCIALELSMLEQFIEHGIKPTELSFIQKYMTRSHAFEIDTAPKRLGHALETEVLGLPGDYHSGYLAHVAGVNPETANAAIKARLSAEDLVVVVVGTASESLEDVQKAIPRLAGHEVVAFDAD